MKKVWLRYQPGNSRAEILWTIIKPQLAYLSLKNVFSDTVLYEQADINFSAAACFKNKLEKEH